MDFEATKDSEDDEMVIKEFATQDGVDALGTQDNADDNKTNKFDDTEGAKFILQLEQTQHSLETGQHWDKTRSDDLPNARDKTKPTKPPHDRPAGDPLPNLEKDKESHHSDASQRIEKERKRAEGILDQETAACKLLFTPKVQHPKEDPHENYELDNLAAEAVQTQLNERGEENEREWVIQRTNMEEMWERKRKAIERQHGEKAEDDTALHVSQITHQMDEAQQECEKLQWDTDQAIQKQKANHSKQMEELHDTIEEATRLREVMTLATKNLKQLKEDTRAEREQLMMTADDARRQSQNLRGTIEANIQDTLQRAADTKLHAVVDTKMSKVEKEIHRMLQKRGRDLAVEVKHEPKMQTEDMVVALEERITRKSEETSLKADETFDMATQILDNAVMQIGEEMNTAVLEVKATLNDP
jgi:hypothetical protein